MKKLFTIFLFCATIFSYAQPSLIGKNSFQFSITMLSNRSSLVYNTYHIKDTMIYKEQYFDTTFFYYFKNDTCIRKRTMKQFVDYVYIIDENHKGTKIYKILKWTPRNPEEIKNILERDNSLNTEEGQELLKKCKKEYENYLADKENEKLKIEKLNKILQENRNRYNNKVESYLAKSLKNNRTMYKLYVKNKKQNYRIAKFIEKTKIKRNLNHILDSVEK